MNDKQFSIGIKISIVLAFIALIVICGAAVYTLRKTDVTSSVLEDVPNSNVVSEQLEEQKD